MNNWILVAILLAAGLAGCKQKSWETLKVQEATKPGPGEVSLVLVGDIMLDRGVKERVMSRAAGDFTFLVRKVAPYVQEADIAFGNFESPISGRGGQIQKKYTFNAPPESMKALVMAGFDVLSLANNHTLDWGPVAIEETSRLLTKTAIMSGGLAAADSEQPAVVINMRGVRVGFLFYCDPDYITSCAREFERFPLRPAYATRENLARDIDALRPNVDVLVVSVHWGIEYRREPEKRTVSRARWMIDRGVDIIAGHHPHVQQRVERYRNGIIFYSLGNFIFDQTHPNRPGTRLGRIYRLIARKGGIEEVLFLPLKLPPETWQPTPLTAGYVAVEDSVPQ